MLTAKRRLKNKVMAHSPLGKQVACLVKLGRMLEIKPSEIKEVREYDCGHCAEDDESDPAKVIKDVVMEQGKTLDKISSRMMQEESEVAQDEHDGEDTFATQLLSNPNYEQGSTLEDFFRNCHELQLDPREPLRLMNQRDGSWPLYWLQVNVIAFARRVVKRGIFRGSLITSLVGLGKTYMIGGIILEVSITIGLHSSLTSLHRLREDFEELAWYTCTGAPNLPVHSARSSRNGPEATTPYTLPAKSSWDQRGGLGHSSALT